MDVVHASPVLVVADVTRLSFEELYRSHYVRMVRVAWLMVGSAAAAEDIVQEVFVKMAQRYDSIDSPPAYLRVAVVNTCRNELRRTRRFSPAPLPEGVVHDSELAETFELLRDLDPKHRAALVLRYVDDCSDDEIASILGIRRATVRSHIHRGLTKLREADRDQ